MSNIIDRNGWQQKLKRIRKDAYARTKMHTAISEIVSIMKDSALITGYFGSVRIFNRALSKTEAELLISSNIFEDDQSLVDKVSLFGKLKAFIYSLKVWLMNYYTDCKNR